MKISFKRYINLVFYLFALFISLSACDNDNATGQKSSPETGNTPTLFKLLAPEQTNIRFENTLEEGLNTNILMYEYFYNGGGVATADFNGDGLMDIYFTSNMGENKLYLQNGPEPTLQFADVTLASGATGRPGPWKTGVNVADVNGDKKPDIYLCYSGAMPAQKRKNQLLINLGNNAQGIPTFADKAEEYGLASSGFSTQSYFFDCDRDGDLDMILLNHNPKNLPILNEAKTAELMGQDDPEKGVRLFVQENGRFRDVTSDAGISGSALTYGLGVGISDLNNDGWPDFYVSNDYFVPDYLYINRQNGTFENTLPESIGHTSQFSMGNDIADFNNDGRQDILTLDMLPEDNERQKLLLSPDNYAKFDHNLRSGFHYQYMRNMLQLNNGNDTFSEVGQLAGISNTDWSWAALAADFNNDGWKDLYITNGYNRDYTNLDFINYMDDYVKKKGRLQRQDVLEIIANMPASDVANYLFSGSGNLQFTNTTSEWGADQVANSNGAAYADLDNDGDLDLVVNNINKPAFVYENQAAGTSEGHYLQVKMQGEGLNTKAIGAKVSLHAAGKKYMLEQFPARGYQSAVSPILHFGLGNITSIDTLIITWPDGRQQVQYDVPADQTLTIFEKDATENREDDKAKPSPVFTITKPPIEYTHPKLNRRDFDRQKLLTGELSFDGPCMVKGDLNNDGREDIFIGGAAGQAAMLYLQSSNGTFTRIDSPAFEEDKMSEDADAAIFDANGDGNADLYVASGGYHQFQPGDPLLEDRLYLNDGKGNFTRNREALPDTKSSNGCIAVSDVNHDGHPDVFVGGRMVPGRYPETPRSYLLVNDGNGRFSDKTADLAPELTVYGMVCDAAWADLDKDGSEELIVAGEWLPVTVFSNIDGQLKNTTGDFFDRTYSGFWNKIKVADLNGDQRPDLIIGNIGTNTQFRISPAEPAELYFSDFDQNGSVDPVLCFYIQGRSYPFITRDELLGQLASYRSRFTSYKSYANATIDDLFTEGELEQAGHLSADHQATTVFLSNGTGKFRQGSLPVQAQFAPVHTINELDYNKDGKKDLLLCGNDSHFKLRLGKSDASYGMLFRGNGDGSFSYIDQPGSGLSISGDVRSTVQIGDLFLFGINQKAIIAYKLNETPIK